MAAPQDTYSFDLEAGFAAAKRWNQNPEQHLRFKEAAESGNYSALDTPERMAKRTNRLLNKLQQAAPKAAFEMATTFEGSLGREVISAEVSAESVSDELLERVIGETRDFLFIEFLEQALFASRAVARIVTPLGGGRTSYGTGFMVSPRLMLTNHHVFPTIDSAAKSKAEFDYQRDRLGRQIPVRSFTFDTKDFFLNNKELDFALVAVSPDSPGIPLANYGWCPLIKDEGKIVAGEPINIIQHPKGELKQVVVTKNLLIEVLDVFAHYEADTEPGSSGSPVFNNQWEVVALHHSGIPKMNAQGDLIAKDGGIWRPGDDPLRLEWVANEGIRVSRLINFIANAQVDDPKFLVKELLESKSPVDILPAPIPVPPNGNPNNDIKKEMIMPEQKSTNGLSVTLTVPLNITFSLGELPTGIKIVDTAVKEGDKAAEQFLEKIEPDPDDKKYKNRPGFQENFLGFKVKFPILTSAVRAQAFALPGVTGDSRFILKYHHYSLIFNKKRKLAFIAGVNYDPTANIQYKREGSDRWFYDPRIEKEFQAGEDLYADNPLDRGHLVRRADAGWGNDEERAKLANDDTFHFTNCSPQHEITNQGKVKEAPPGLKLWGKLEDHVASQGKKNTRKLSVFNGPVFRANDDEYRGVKIPKEFWKVIVFAHDNGKPGAAAFILSQETLVQGLKEEIELGEYKSVQVSIKHLETATGLDFGLFTDWDVLEKEEAEENFMGEGVPAVILESVGDMVL